MTHRQSTNRAHPWVSMGISICLGVSLLWALGKLAWSAKCKPLAGDERLAAHIRGSTTGHMEILFYFLSRLASLPLWNILVLLAAVALWRTGRKERALLLAASPSVEVPTALMKAVIRRRRPPNGAPRRWVPTASFPSGHVVRTLVTLALWIAPIARPFSGRQAVSLIGGSAFLLLMSLARVASGEHWPSDVLGSYLLGVSWLNVLWLGWTWLRHYVRR